MARLLGPQRAVLRAILDCQGEDSTFIADETIAKATGISVGDISDWLLTLGDDDYVDLVRTRGGLKAGVTPKGRLTMGLSRPRESDGLKRPTVTPNGLRPFDKDHARYFLDLLPGQRNEGELPEVIQFWKTRVEEEDPLKAFRVGVIYGASGCGKSSLLKAGLLPHLSSRILQLPVEATETGTESDLLRGLRRCCPNLPDGIGLSQSLLELQRGTVLTAGKKVLVILDQFEQWLLRNEKEDKSELASALQKCDASRLQTILVVRADFWVALTGFLRKIEIEVSSNRNARAVELFGPAHTKKVLLAFGKSYSKFDEPLTKSQEAFVERAVNKLALENGMILPVRLVLFVETLRNSREWTTETLERIGDVEGVGVDFLKNTFNSGDYADPRYREHQEAAQKVLEALLPKSGSEIKRVRRTRTDLLLASGYAPGDHFDELLRILDEELRLITPVIQERKTNEPNQCSSQAAEQYYQLTHDYLVPSVREWRNDKEQTAARLVNDIRMAETNDVPALVLQLSNGLRELADPLLLEAIKTSDENAKQHLHARLALLPAHNEHIGFLLCRLLRATISEFSVIRDALRPFATETVESLWSELERLARSDRSKCHAADTAEKQYQDLRAAGALAIYDGANSRWAGIAEKVARALLRCNARDLHYWLEALRPARVHLTAPLAAIFRDENSLESDRKVASDLLEDYASDQPELLTELLMNSGEDHFEQWFSTLQRQRDLAASLLRTKISRCDVAEDELDLQARRQARAAVALARLDYMEEILPLLIHCQYPCLRSYIINWLKPLGMNPGVIFARLEHAKPEKQGPGVRNRLTMDEILYHPDTSSRRASIIALGEFEASELSVADLERCTSFLLEAYRSDPDAGIHGAAEWTMRRWKMEERLSTIKDSQLNEAESRRWFLNSQDETFARINGPVKFLMGSTRSANCRDDETQHFRIIDRSFAVAARAVSRDQYSEFAKVNRRHVQLSRASRRNFLGDVDKWSPDLRGPLVCASWYDAAAFCNWLSEKENLECCYAPNEKDQYAEGMTTVAGFLKRTGYRLPTESEWEYACRAGSLTLRYYADSDELLDQYAWYFRNSNDRAWAGGRLKPNDLGLFDMLGNVLEWCHDEYKPYDKTEGSVDLATRKATPLKDRDYRFLRGGAYGSRPTIVRSAVRSWYPMYVPGISYGFRLARTCP